MKGYREIADKVLSNIKRDDVAGKTKAREQWKQ
jgi:hypothetical protein